MELWATFNVGGDLERLEEVGGSGAREACYDSIVKIDKWLISPCITN
jgi:hypothetical protein